MQISTVVQYNRNPADATKYIWAGLITSIGSSTGMDMRGRYLGVGEKSGIAFYQVQHDLHHH